MNLIFGIDGTSDVAAQFATACERINHAHDARCDVLPDSSRTTRTGYLSDMGKIFGRDSRENVSLLYLGSIHKPVTGWGPGSPLDDPDKTARLLLDRYLLNRDGFLDGLQGQYAIVVCDKNTGTRWLASDPGGMRSIYYRADQQCLIFSTNLASVARLSADGPVIDRQWEDFFLIYGFYPWRHTPYENITMLAPGTLLEWKAGEIRTWPIKGGNPWEHADIGNIPDEATEQETVNKLYDAFMTALEDQAASSDRAAVLLGGVDSALVAAGLCRLGKQVETFSFQYAESRYNQPHTDTVAQYLGIEHHWVAVTAEDIALGLENFSNDFNAPTNWPNYVIQTKIVCDAIRRRGHYYCYSGDGCDTIFLGYPGTHRRTALLSNLPVLPGRLVDALVWLFAIQLLERKIGHPYRVILNIIRSLRRKMPESSHVTLRIFDEISLDQLRMDALPEQAMDIESILCKLAAPLEGMTAERLGYHGKGLISPNKNKIIGSSDNTGIVINSPYMHAGLKSLAMNMKDTLSRPREKTVAAVTGKYILLKMAEDKKLLPREAIYQKKLAAVAAPVDAWYMGPLKGRMINILQDLPFQANAKYLDSLFDDKLAERIYREHISPSEVTSDGISLLATYASFSGLSM